MSMYEYSYVDYVVSHAQIEKEKQSLKKKNVLCTFNLRPASRQ